VQINSGVFGREFGEVFGGFESLHGVSFVGGKRKPADPDGRAGVDGGAEVAQSGVVWVGVMSVHSLQNSPETPMSA
jgi:hypothetical protein